MGPKIETDRDIIQRVRGLGTPSPKRDVSIHSHLSGLRESFWHGSRKSGRTIGDEGHQKIKPSKSSGSMQTWTHWGWVNMHSARKSLHQMGSRAERKSGHMSPSLTLKLSPVDNHLQIKVLFSPRDFVEEASYPWRVDSCPAVDGQTQWDLFRFLVS